MYPIPQGPGQSIYPMPLQMVECPVTINVATLKPAARRDK
jgi:hypothetical protein